MTTQPRWRKLGKAYVLSDHLSTLYIKRIDSRFHLLWRRDNPMQPGFSPLGRYRTLREAQSDGLALMEVKA